MDLSDVKDRVFSLPFLATILLVGIFIAAGVFLLLGNPKNPDFGSNPLLPTQNTGNKEYAGSDSGNPNALANPNSTDSNQTNPDSNNPDFTNPTVPDNSQNPDSTIDNNQTPPTAGGCGNGFCEAPETCANCSTDCGACPVSDCVVNGGTCRSSCNPNESVYSDSEDCIEHLCCIIGLV